jgi:eukaryotic-like serine/threonine-protein kinase
MSDNDMKPKGEQSETAAGGASAVTDSKPAPRFRGKKFGRYTLLQRIAHGGMGEIFLARQSGHGGFSKLVAIKRILSHYSDDDDHVRMFFDEAKLQAILNDRHIVQIYDMGKVGEHLFICMEYIHGISMRRLIRRIRKKDLVVHPAHACELMIQVCRGLSYAHNVSTSQGQQLQIVHRDINPQNLLISFNGELKIIDFGIAKSEMSEVQTESGTLKGKFTYMSPEQGGGLPLDQRSDIFSVGICLYELLTGINPFKRANLVLSLSAIQQETPMDIGELRSDAVHFEPILKLALAKNRDERFKDCADLGEALQNLVQSGKCGQEPMAFGAWIKSLFKSEIEEHLALLEQMGSVSEIAMHSGPTLRRTATAALPSTLLADDESQSITGGLESQSKNNASGDDDDNDDDSVSSQSQSSLIHALDPDTSTSPVSKSRPPGTDTTNTGLRPQPVHQSVSVPYQTPGPTSMWASLLPGIASGVLIGLVGLGLYSVLRPAPEQPRVEAPAPIDANRPKATVDVVPVEPPIGAVQPETAETPPEDAKAVEPATAAAENASGSATTDGSQAAPGETNTAAPSDKPDPPQKVTRTTSRKTKSKRKSKPRTTGNVASAGTLKMRISGGYRFSGSQINSGTSVSLKLSSSQKKTLRIRGANKPFKIDINLQERGGKLYFSVKSAPWAIVRMNNRSQGKTPTKLSIAKGQIARVALKNPKAGEVKFSFKWSGN